MESIMISEKALQAKLIKWLKTQGCEVIKTTPGSGVPTGFPDVVFFYKDRYGLLEVKHNEKSKFQPLQKATLKKFDNMGGFARVVHNDNFDEIRLEILEYLAK